MNALLVNALSLSLIIAPAILCGLWVHRRLRQKSASVWTLSTAMGISLTGMGAMMGLLSGESYLIGFSLVFGTTSGIGFGLWMIDNPELWRGIGISSLEPAWLQGDILLGKRSI
jgi:hypothetical protein